MIHVSVNKYHIINNKLVSHNKIHVINIYHIINKSESMVTIIFFLFLCFCTFVLDLIYMHVAITVHEVKYKV